jgi:hypothetical protein
MLVAVAALPPILRLATAVVEATTKGAVPVARVDVIWPEAETVVAPKVVKVPAAAAVPPIAGGDARYVLNPVPDTVEEDERVVNEPAAAAVPPMAGGEANCSYLTESPAVVPATNPVSLNPLIGRLAVTGV